MRNRRSHLARRTGRFAVAMILCLLVSSVSCDRESNYDFLKFDLLEHSFRATRRFTLHNQEVPVTYLEEVTSVGDGKQFQVQLLELDNKKRSALDAKSRDRFDDLKSHLRFGGGRRALYQRDPRVSSVDLFLKNYRVFRQSDGPPSKSKDMALATSAPAERSLTLLVVPRLPDRPHYEYTVSLEPGRKGFPLGYREYRLNERGRRVLVSSMEVETLEYGIQPRLALDISPVISRRCFEDCTTAQDEAEIPLHYPAWLPDGFELILVEEVVQRTEATETRTVEPVKIYRFVFSDGLDRLELFQHRPTYWVEENDPFTAGARETSLTIPVYQFGSIQGAILIQDDYQVVVESRISAPRFEQVLKNLRQF